MRVQENKVESGMAGMNIADQRADCVINQPSAENQGMTKGCGRHKFNRHGAGPENKAQWREMRRQRMAMIRQAMKDNYESTGFAPYGMMPPMMFGPPPPGFGPHHHHHMYRHGRGHFHPRFHPMMYVGPQSNQFEGDLNPFMVPRPVFHPGMMAMMMPMFTGYDIGSLMYNKTKCKKGEFEASLAADNTQESGEERPPFMMQPWMFKGRRFRKCMNPDDCQKMAKQNLAENGEKEQNESAGMETDEKANDSLQISPHENKQQIRFMKRIMAMDGGYPPMVTMYPGAVCPPRMMRKFMQKNKCQHKKKCDKSESEDSSVSSCDDVSDEHSACKDTESVPELSDIAEKPEGTNSDTPVGNENGNDHHKKHGWHRRQMRAMMMNGGFSPMWFMMSQGGDPYQQFRHKGKVNPKHQKPNDKDKNQIIEDEMC